MGFSSPREAAHFIWGNCCCLEPTRNVRERLHFMYQGQLTGSGCLEHWVEKGFEVTFNLCRREDRN